MIGLRGIPEQIGHQFVLRYNYFSVFNVNIIARHHTVVQPKFKYKKLKNRMLKRSNIHKKNTSKRI